MLVNLREKKKTLEQVPADVLLQIGMPDVKWYHLNGQYQAVCPFHNDHHLGSFGYNLTKDAWSCFVCGKSGKGVYSLIMAYQGWDFKKTIDYLYEHRNEPVSAISTPPASMMKKQGMVKMLSVTNVPKEVSSVWRGPGEEFPYDTDISPEDLSAIYGSFAAASPLQAKEADNLCVERGLYYRSLSQFFHCPSPDDEEFMERFRDQLSGFDSKPGEERLYHKLLGVPGFYWDTEKGRPSFVSCAYGLGILNYGVNGEVNGIEYRVKTEDNASRYLWFSSGSICKKYPEKCLHGTSASAKLDVVYPVFDNKPYLGVAITEGKFKAIQLSYLGYLAVSIHGVANWARSLEILRKLAAKGEDVSKVTIVFDADSRTNTGVARQAVRCGKKMMAEGYETVYLTWSAKLGKGIDDVINAGYRNKLREVPAQRFIDTTLAPFLERASKTNGGK